MADKKNVKRVVNLEIPAGQANPAPPIGTALGPHGINTGDFCRQFNDETKDMGGDVVRVSLNIYDDRSFDFKVKLPTTSFLIKKAAGIEKGASNSLTETVGKLTQADLRDIAEKKMGELSTNTIEGAMKIIAGTAKNMGVKIVD